MLAYKIIAYEKTIYSGFQTLQVKGHLTEVIADAPLKRAQIYVYSGGH